MTDVFDATLQRIHRVATVDADSYAPDMASLVEAGMWREAEVGEWHTPLGPWPAFWEAALYTFSSTRGTTIMMDGLNKH